MSESYFGQHRGAQIYGSEKKQPVVFQASPDSFVLQKLPATEPETERRLDIHEELRLPANVDKECAPFNWQVNANGVPEMELNLSGQQGYKSKDFVSQGLSGCLGALNGCSVEAAKGLGSRFGPEGEEIVFEVSDNVINETKSSYKYGSQGQVPNDGLYLAGTKNILLKGSGDGEGLVYPTLREGAKISGRYAGSQAPKSSIDHKLRDHENSQL